MTAEDTLRVIHDWYGMRGDWTRVPELAGPEYIRHEPAGTRTVTGEQVREELNARGYTIQWEYNAFAEGDIAFVTWVARDTPRGDMSGVQAYRYRLKDGLIVDGETIPVDQEAFKEFFA